MAIILVGMAAIFFSGLYRYLSFDCLKLYHATLKEMIDAHPVGAPVIYILIYIALTALSVPGAVFLSLLGGYLFPEPFSMIYVLFWQLAGQR